MSRLKYYLTELFDTKTKIKLIFQDFNKKYIYQFFINNKRYNVIISFRPYNVNVWDITFALMYSDTEYSENITGTGNSFEVFATVFKCLKDFIKKEKPINNIQIEVERDDYSRMKLYDKLVKNKAKEFGYKLLKKERVTTHISWIFTRIKNE